MQWMERVVQRLGVLRKRRRGGISYLVFGLTLVFGVYKVFRPTLHFMFTAMESGNLKAWKKAYVTTEALVSAPAIFMNLEIILGRRTQPCSSLSWIGCEFSAFAEHDLTRMSNSPAQGKRSSARLGDLSESHRSV